MAARISRILCAFRAFRAFWGFPLFFPLRIWLWTQFLDLCDFCEIAGTPAGPCRNFEASTTIDTTPSRRLPEGGLATGGCSDLMENRSVWGFGRHRAAQKPFKKVGGSAPYLLTGFLGRPGPPRTPKRPIFHQITKPPSAEPPSGNRRDLRTR